LKRILVAPPIAGSRHRDFTVVLGVDFLYMKGRQSSNGKNFESLIELIERSVSVGSKVERDIRLPVVSSKTGRSAQCDLVIWSGDGARKTLSIVEVQDRNSRVKPNEFRGWLKKLEDVGVTAPDMCVATTVS
jgi:hypothetical protein